MDHISASGNGTATPGSDQQAAILFKPTGGSNRSANGIITNSQVNGGGIKYYEGNLSGTMTVKDTYSEGINGGAYPGGVGTFWAASTNAARSQNTTSRRSSRLIPAGPYVMPASMFLLGTKEI